MKSFIPIFTCLFFLQFSSIEAQNQAFYAGFSLGIGGTFTHLDENVGNLSLIDINPLVPPEILLGYRLNPSLAVQLIGGLQKKTYKVLPDEFFQNANAPTIGYGFTQVQSSPHIGVNLLYRKPIGASSKNFVGGLIGYSRAWYSSGSPSTGTCNDFERSAFPKDCEDGGVIVNYHFEEAANHFLAFGIFYEKIIGRNANRALRLGLNYRKGGGNVTPVGGEVYYLENDERAETVNFYSNGSMLSFDVSYMFGFGNEKN